MAFQEYDSPSEGAVRLYNVELPHFPPSGNQHTLLSYAAAESIKHGKLVGCTGVADSKRLYTSSFSTELLIRRRIDLTLYDAPPPAGSQSR